MENTQNWLSEINKGMNYLSYDIKGLERRRNKLLQKAILGSANEEDRLRLEAVDKILRTHLKGERIDELLKEY